MSLRDDFADMLGAEAVIDQLEAMEPYLNESRGLFRGQADIVVRPANSEQVADIVRYCADKRLPITPQGGLSGACAGALPRGGVVLSLARMNKIREIDVKGKIVLAEAGCLLADVREAADQAGMRFPLTLASEGSCQIGGNIATNAGGANAFRFGCMRNFTVGLEAVFADGRIWNGLQNLRKDNSGYDLRNLLIGSEGTLAIITAAMLRLVPKVTNRAVIFCAFESAQAAMEVFFALDEEFSERFAAYELISQSAMEAVCSEIEGANNPFAKFYPWNVLVEFTETTDNDSLSEEVLATLGKWIESGKIIDAVSAQNLRQMQQLRHVRESISPALKAAGGVIKHDISVPVARLAEFLEVAKQKLQEQYDGFQPCPFGHAGDGNLHYNVLLPHKMIERGGITGNGIWKQWQQINELIHDLVAAFGGSFAAEHGVGILQQEAFYRYKSEIEIKTMTAIKRALDPLNILNPGKIVIAHPSDKDLPMEDFRK